MRPYYLRNIALGLLVGTTGCFYTTNVTPDLRNAAARETRPLSAPAPSTSDTTYLYTPATIQRNDCAAPQNLTMQQTAFNTTYIGKVPIADRHDQDGFFVMRGSAPLDACVLTASIAINQQHDGTAALSARMQCPSGTCVWTTVGTFASQ